MSLQTESILSQVYNCIELCKIEQATLLLTQAYEADLENTDLVFAIKCCRFWQNTINELSALENFDQGEALVNQWKQFQTFLQREKNPTEKTVYSFKKGIFSLALDCYSKAFDENSTELKSEISRKKGLCFKKLGSYEKAQECLKEANSIMHNQAATVAEMADCYALCGETKFAKLLFREAFFIDAQKIDFDFLDSPMITLLIKEIADKTEYSGSELKEWIPVYGILLGVFNVKRELRSQEVLRLRQEIYAKESEIKDPANNTRLIKPRLMNLYLWQADHYEQSRENVSKMNELLIKIKILDESIWKIYVDDSTDRK